MVRCGYEVIGGLIKWSYMVIKDPRHKEIIKQEKGQHDNTFNISTQNSSLLISPSIISVIFQWDKVVMSFHTYVMLELMFPYF